MDNYNDIEQSAASVSQTKPKVTDDKTILARFESGAQFMKPHINKANRASNRYLDSSAKTLYRDSSYDQEIKDIPVGEVNYLAMNIRQKAAAIAIGAPDVVVKLKDGAPGEYGQIVRQYIRETWLKKRWGRVFRRVITQRYVSGMGHLSYLWDRNTGFEVEFTETKDTIFDPNTTQDTWDKPRWAAKFINVPVDIAVARYGKAILDLARSEDENRSPYANTDKDKGVYRIGLYYDETCEAEKYGDVVLRKGPNLYGRVPLRALIGDINPAGEFPLGDFDTSLGIFEMHRRLQNIINNTAQNGGGIPWLRSEYIDEKIRQKVINGTHNGYVLVTGVPGEQAVGYTANNPLSDAVLQAMKLMQDGIDSDTGVSNLDRGVTENVSESATQTALRANRSSGRANLARIEYEQFVEDILNEMVKLTAKFGNDPDSENTDEAQILWEACSAVTEVRIIEESSTFKDPSMLQQQNLQLFQLAASTFPLMAQMGTPPNLKALFDDVLRSFDKRDVEKYYISQQDQLAMQQQAMMQQQAAMQQQAGGGAAEGPGQQPGQSGGQQAPPQDAGQPQQ